MVVYIVSCLPDVLARLGPFHVACQLERDENLCLSHMQTWASAFDMMKLNISKHLGNCVDTSISQDTPTHRLNNQANGAICMTCTEVAETIT